MDRFTDLDLFLQEREAHDLIQNLRSPYADVRHKAHKGLVKMGEQAIHPLITLLHEEDDCLTTEAALILGEITGPRGPHSLIAYLINDNPMLRWNATKLLFNMGRGGLVALLEAVIENYTSIRLRFALLEILRMLTENQQLTWDEQKILDTLEGPYPDDEVAHVAQMTLEELKNKHCPDVKEDALPSET